MPHELVYIQAIFMFGEIDCREGLTMAVDKLKYDTLEAAMDVLLDIYMGACGCSPHACHSHSSQSNNVRTVFTTPP